MTRETKVGLLVGCGIILLIGIVVSDHLSVASNDSSADLLQFGSKRTTPALRHATPAGANGLSPSEAAPRRRPVPLPQEMNRSERESEQAEREHAGPSGESPNGDTERSPRKYGLEIVPAQRIVVGASQPQQAPRQRGHVQADARDRATRASARSDASGPTDSGESDLSESSNAPGSSVLRPVVIGPEASAARDRTTRSASGERSDAPSPPAGSESTVIHKVEQGQTLYEIAEHYYGKGEYWRSIREANPTVVDRRGHVSAGARLLIPNKAGRIRAQALTPTDEEREAAVGDAGRASTTGTPRITRTYTVRAGDTLSSIAAEQLGDEKLWYDLYEANREVLDDGPDSLSQGKTLTLPALSSERPSDSSGG